MKQKLLLLFLASFFVFHPGYSDNKVFPTSDAIWNVHLYKNGYYRLELFYGLSGDTIINEMLYNKLYFLVDTTLVEDPHHYLGGIRQEGKQVWFLPGCDDWDEFLLYDFSKKTGDWVEHGLIPGFGPWNFPYPDCKGSPYTNYTTYICDVEDSKWGKKLLISQHWEQYWIEGIGDTNGLFSNFMAFPLDCNSYTYRLACLKVGNELVYLDNKFCETCFCLVEGPDVNAIDEIEQEPIYVFANKLNKTIHVVSDFGYDNLDFVLLNTQGQVIKEEKLSLSDGNIRYVNINPGVYIFQIRERGKVIQSGKLLLE
ncbi:T9SS type A sorting domain-containing protein [Bacteroidales bacterium OttesenSCG-928-M11]|nr:T9SS type A sorting domain-containing protein [Bacteroidales bacterium OttesenSCG-928-M11]